MDKLDIIEKLKEVGIITENCYPKTPFKSDEVQVVGLFAREMKDDFYFYNVVDKKIYLFPKPKDIKKYPQNNFMGQIKHLIPIEECEEVWVDKPHVELEDKSFSTMTLREYACIHLGVPNSGLPWLDHLIKSAKND